MSKTYSFANENVYFKISGSDVEIRLAIKKIPGSRWNGSIRKWIVPIVNGNEDLIADIIIMYNLKETFDESLEEATQHIYNTDKDYNELRAITDPKNFTYTPRNYQLDCLDYLLKHRQVLVADDIGIGKTFEAIMGIEIEMAFPCLVIVPSSVKYNWDEKWREITGNENISIINAGKNKRDWDKDIVIINYDLLANKEKSENEDEEDKVVFKFSEIGEVKWASIICDEAHFLKNKKASRSQIVAKLIKKIPIRYLLTGTPAGNRPEEIINLLVLLGQFNKISPNWKHFIETYCDGYRSNYGWVTSGQSNLIELNQVLRNTCYIRREKREVDIELPNIIKQIIPTQITNKKAYKEAEKDVVQYILHDEGFDAALAALSAEHLVKIGKLRKLSIEGKVKGIIQYLKDWKETCGGKKLLVFGVHREPLLKLAKHFKCDVIMGGMTPKKKHQIVKKFQVSDDIFLFGNVKSIGTGTDGLQEVCSNAILIELPWTLLELEQVIGRIDRVGQKEVMSFNFLLSNETIDMGMYEMLSSKEAVTTAANKGIDISKTKGNLKTLFKNLVI